MAAFRHTELGDILQCNMLFFFLILVFTDKNSHYLLHGPYLVEL